MTIPYLQVDVFVVHHGIKSGRDKMACDVHTLFLSKYLPFGTVQGRHLLEHVLHKVVDTANEQCQVLGRKKQQQQSIIFMHFTLSISYSVGIL